MEVIMADDPLNPRPLPFNIPEGMDVIKSRDPEFWAAYRRWRAAEDNCNALRGEASDDPRAELLLDRSTKLLDELLAVPVRSATALLAKLAALREGYSGQAGVNVAPSITALHCIEWDVERIAKFELWGPDAFEDMAEG
jgi:hypothetical protein